MHYYDTKTVRRENYDRYKTAQNLEVIEEYLDFSHYNVWIPAEEFVDHSGTTTLTVRNSAPIRRFATGDLTSVTASLRRPRMWINGVVSVRIWYTGDGTAGNAHTIGVSIILAAEAGAIAAHSFSNIAVPVVGTASILEIDRQAEAATATSYTLDQADDLILVGIRKAADAASRDFDLIGVELFYMERATPQGFKGHPRARTAGRYVSRA